MPVKELFPWDSFPFRLELKDRVAWFQCQEHMDKEIASIISDLGLQEVS